MTLPTRSLWFLVLCSAGAASLAWAQVSGPPAPAGAFAYRMTGSGDTALLSWLVPEGEGHRLQCSSYSEGRWGAVREVVEREGMFANWADTPAVVRGGDGALYAHWLQKSGEATYAYDIRVSRSTDDGVSWVELGKLNDDDVIGEHGFVSYVPGDHGVTAFWLDGRATGGGHGEGHDEGHGGQGMMTLRTAPVGEALHASSLVDDSVCDCCPTAAFEVGDEARVVYRDRSAAEIRDISVAGGSGGDSPVSRDGWKIPGCPVNGPAVAAWGDDVYVAWFTAAAGAEVRFAVSGDGAGSFGEARSLDAERPVGRPALVAGPGGAIVVWIGAEGRLLGQRIGRDGEPGARRLVARIDGARASGFPQAAWVDGRLLVVWRDVGADRLRSKALSGWALE